MPVNFRIAVFLAAVTAALAGLLIYKRDPSAAYKQEPYVPAAGSLRPAARPRMA